MKRNYQERKPAKTFYIPVSSTYQQQFRDVTIDRDDLISFLDDIEEVFNLISVPLYCPRYIAMDDRDAKGDLVIGHVNSYNVSDQTFEVTVYAKYVDLVDGMSTANIAPKILINNNNEISKLIAVKVVR